MTFRAILEDLLSVTAASRTTLRLDLPREGLHVDRVAAEAVAAGVRHIGDDSSIDQRALPTVRFLEEERRPLVQDDCLDSDPAPPRELIEFYGVKAQMLGPLVLDDSLTGWISVHHTPGHREWSEKDVDALRDAVRRVRGELASRLVEAERKLAAFQEILDDLLEATSASRTTIRLDSPSDGFHLDAVAAEALAPGVRTLKDDTSITNLREVPTVRFLDEERRLLVQNDCMTADPAVPRKLIELYGVKAQMLGPLVREGDLIGVISVHHNLGPREWSARDIEALQDAVHRVQQTLV